MRRCRRAPEPLFLGGDAAAGIRVHRVALESVGDEHVLPPVEIDIEKHGGPGPVAGVESGELGDFGEGAVAARELQGVMRDLRARGHVQEQRHIGIGFIALHEPPPVLPAEHVHDKNVVIPIAIHIRDIDAHRGERCVAKGLHGRSAESSGAIPEPNAIGRGKVVADVDIGRAVAIEVANHHGESPIARRGSQGRPLRVEEEAVGPGQGHEAAAARIAKEGVRLAEFVMQHSYAAIGQRPVCKLKAVRPFRIGQWPAVDGRDDRPPVVLAQCELHRRLIANGGGAVVGDVEVQQTVAVEVRQSQRRSAPAPVQERRGGIELEMAAAVVDENRRAAPDGIHKQIQIAIAVEVGERATGGIEMGQLKPGGVRDVLKPPAPEIPPQRTASAEARKEQVDESVAVDVPGGDAGAVEKNLVGEGAIRRQ